VVVDLGCWWILDAGGFSFALLRRVCWPALEECYETKLGTYNSNPNLRFVSMNELEFFLLTRVMTQNSNTMELVNFLEKSQNPKFYGQKKVLF
jgi:hypothetical protein